MEKVKLLCLTLFYIFKFSSICVSQVPSCENIVENQSGEISISTEWPASLCWKIVVPKDHYIRLELKDLTFHGADCSDVFIRIDVAGTNEEFKYCSKYPNPKSIIALNDVSLHFVQSYDDDDVFSFQFHYRKESLVCVRKNHFRCSDHACILQNQICNGVKDCENGKDEIGCETGVVAVKGVNTSQENAILWLKKQQSASFGWGRNTHRAITALYLTGIASFRGDILEEELIAKQLELQISVALLRNSSDPLLVSDLSMFINALTVTCHNTRHFYGYDLLQILSERLAASKSPNPGAHLTLCNANRTFSESHTRNLLRVLHKHSEYPFHLDVQAMTVMALSCVKNRTQDFDNIQNATKLYNATVHQFITGQLPDGSFGNVYTTALVTQALLSSGQENNKSWRLNSTIKFLMQELNVSSDFLSIYLTLPIFKGKSLVDIGNVNCTIRRKHGEDEEISEITNKLGGKMRIQYSLYIGEQKDVIHTMFLRMPENSTAYDVMRVAQVADHKYKFLHRDVSGHMYVYDIAGITNDTEAGKFWLLYTGDSHTNGTTKHHTESPDEFTVGDGEHLIMWYKTAHV